MRLPSRRRIKLLSLLLSANTASAISLSDFYPKNYGLPWQCNKVYEGTIDGCASSDFRSGATCSPACVEGLNKIASEVELACGATMMQDKTIIGRFLLGDGPARLCPNTDLTSPKRSAALRTSTVKHEEPLQPSGTITVIVTSIDESTPPPPSTSTVITHPDTTSTVTVTKSSTSKEAGQSSPPRQLPSPSSSSPSRSAPPSTTDGSLTMDPSATRSESSAATSTRDPDSNTALGDSGGGSPFDFTAGSPKLGSTSPWSVALVAALFAAVVMI